ncbi:MAG: hypothetical protein MRJ68_11495 [Nitrospira sp.]|nr:hypothetical protein [Nitrospira sp.]
MSLFTRRINYVETSVYVGHLLAEWRAISSELRRAKIFQRLCTAVLRLALCGDEDLWFNEPKNDQDFAPSSEQKKHGVIQEWPAGTMLYRTRRADTWEDYTRLVLKPTVELARLFKVRG